jgi:hypothetical protein
MGTSKKEPADRKKEGLKFEEKNRERRAELKGKQEEKRAARKAVTGKQAEWAQKGIEEEKQQEIKSKKEVVEFKKRKKKTEEEIKIFQAKKREEEARLEAKRKEREDERKAQLAYLKEMSNRNRWQVNKDKKIRSADEKKTAAKIEADRNVQQVKLQSDVVQRQKIRNAQKDALKKRGAANIKEEKSIADIRNAARGDQSKLKAQEQTSILQLESRLDRDKAIANSYTNPAQRQMEIRKVEMVEKRERSRITNKFKKLSEGIEVKANQDIERIKRDAKIARNKATSDERKQKTDAQHERNQTRLQANKDSLQKKQKADKLEETEIIEARKFDVGE